ncbi:unnamed protein product, partial [marine sediment metagenome]
IEKQENQSIIETFGEKLLNFLTASYFSFLD